MKIKFSLLLLASISILSCVRHPEPMYTGYTPVLITKESLAKSITLQGPAPLENAAKIFYKDGLIYVSERYKGIHIIDNANPAQPIKKGFISIPGCVDMAVKDDVLYADNAVDLVAISLAAAEKGTLQILKRTEDVFPEILPPDGREIPVKYNRQNRPSNTVIIAWRK